MRIQFLWGRIFDCVSCKSRRWQCGSGPVSETISKQAGTQLPHMAIAWWHHCKQGSWFLLHSAALKQRGTAVSTTELGKAENLSARGHQDWPQLQASWLHDISNTEKQPGYLFPLHLGWPGETLSCFCLRNEAPTASECKRTGLSYSHEFFYDCLTNHLLEGQMPILHTLSSKPIPFSCLI